MDANVKFAICMRWPVAASDSSLSFPYSASGADMARARRASPGGDSSEPAVSACVDSL